MITVPKWLAVCLIPLEFAVVLFLVPYLVSLLTARHGWTDGWPGPWNLLGLVLVAAGAVGTMWSLGLHVVKMPAAVPIESTPRFLLTAGPYRFSRNPMYITVLTMWLGWTIVYGSVAISVVLLTAWFIVVFVAVPFEERRLERRFGDAYLQYKGAVPRWLGAGRAGRP
jgi:protein-S-isoprenylcysteine O-methyltransferase Ste14